jgi:thymidylate kinase
MMHSSSILNSKIIVFSGIDGSGKSTQIDLLNKYFDEKGKSIYYLWTRGGSTPWINNLKKFARKLAGKKLPPPGHSKERDKMLSIGWVQKTWLILSIIDLIRIYCFKIRILIFFNKVVLCDRYIWDTYIDFKIAFSSVDIDNWFLWRFLVKFSPSPCKSFLLLIPLTMSEERCSQKHDPFPDKPDIRKKRFDYYELLSSHNYWKIIDATQPIDLVFENIKN